VLTCAELASRLIVAAASNPRWDYFTGLVVAVGFSELNDILEPDPERFWRVKRNLEKKHLSGRIGNVGPISFTVSTDEQGHRRLPDVQDARHQVFFLGDSCTFGVAVNDDETFPALLQRRMPGVRCINAGVPGYSAYQGRVTLEGTSFDRAPDVVVISFFWNDDSPWGGLSDAEHAEALARDNARWIRRSRLVTILTSLKPRAKAAPARVGEAARPRLTDEEYADELRGIVARCRAMGSEPILMVWPMLQQMVTGEQFGKQEVMRRIAEDEDVSLIDLVPLFRSQQAPVFADVVHANAAGHRLVADRLEPAIESVLHEGPETRNNKQNPGIHE
jgi:lysophospholipase L1-like esterase